MLPDQGPIGVFVHHNTLHAFQHLSFHDAVQAGASDLGARPYLSLTEFRAAVQSGRIALDDVRSEIDEALGDRRGDEVLPRLSRAGLWRVLLLADCDGDDAAGLAFAIKAGLAEPCQDPALWEACLARVSRGPHLVHPDTRVVRRHRDVLVALGASDPDEAVHGELIRLGAGFLDQGQAHAALPNREHGFLRAVAELYADGASAPRDCRGAERDMRQVFEQQIPARGVIEATLDALGVRDADVEPFLYASALALPGWAGMFSRLERHPEDLSAAALAKGDHDGGPPTALIDFLAVRLLLERRAIERACRDRRRRVRLDAPAIADAADRPGPAGAGGVVAVARGPRRRHDRRGGECARRRRARRRLGASAWRVPTSSVAG